ncbi:hypothetical protein CYMTET_14310 [Cymbomonas tetramitiformis]|uniref:Uncharacterized protein n=1 Tax=Cymbomonas tetramitiformis TaxID=36881 RepID=A0AAE0G4M6_9CHLO|nr:hypothetical protein CYMTET_20150 [Cymbomonas tetramitiformis]KAK3277727.1 hypothetical protein CYMTET_14310 [Cymbomonas tetramitiformis]
MSVMMMMPKRARSRLKKLLPEKRTKHSEAANNVSISGRNSNDDAQSDDARTVTDSEAEQAEQAEQAENPSTGTLPGPSTSAGRIAGRGGRGRGASSTARSRNSRNSRNFHNFRGMPHNRRQEQREAAEPSEEDPLAIPLQARYWEDSMMVFNKELDRFLTQNHAQTTTKLDRLNTTTEAIQQKVERQNEADAQNATNLTNAASKTVTELEAASAVVKNFVDDVNNSFAKMPEKQAELARQNDEFWTHQKQKVDEHVQVLGDAAKAITQDLNTASQVAKTVVADLKSIPTENMGNPVASESQNTQFAEILKKVDQVIDGMETKKYDGATDVQEVFLKQNEEVIQRAKKDIEASFEAVQTANENLHASLNAETQKIENTLSAVGEGVVEVNRNTQNYLSKMSAAIDRSEMQRQEEVRNIAIEAASTILEELAKITKAKFEAESEAAGTSSIPQDEGTSSSSENSQKMGTGNVVVRAIVNEIEAQAADKNKRNAMDSQRTRTSNKAEDARSSSSASDAEMSSVEDSSEEAAEDRLKKMLDASIGQMKDEFAAMKMQMKTENTRSADILKDLSASVKDLTETNKRNATDIRAELLSALDANVRQASTSTIDRMNNELAAMKSTVETGNTRSATSLNKLAASVDDSIEANKKTAIDIRTKLLSALLANEEQSETRFATALQTAVERNDQKTNARIDELANVIARSQNGIGDLLSENSSITATRVEAAVKSEVAILSRELRAEMAQKMQEGQTGIRELSAETSEIGKKLQRNLDVIAILNRALPHSSGHF